MNNWEDNAFRAILLIFVALMTIIFYRSATERNECYSDMYNLTVCPR